MKIRRKIYISFIMVLIVFLDLQFLSASNGRISGEVTDQQTGEALLGAILVIKGTALSTSSDWDGQYVISNVPAGDYILQVTCIGYQNAEYPLNIKAKDNIIRDVEMAAVATEGEGIASQAISQNKAINRQLTSENIISVVSPVKIRELPDANAAESVGKLPGIYLLRNGGEANKIAIRGLQPMYNEVMINGVRIPSTNPNDRSIDISMIPSDMLSGIEVYKTVTPDIDGAFLGGMVNFQMAEAKKSPSGSAEIDLSVEGGYKDLTNSYNPYRFSGSIGDRFLDDRLGIRVQGVIGKSNLTSDNLSASYYIFDDGPAVENLTTTFNPSMRMRYNASAIMDYRLPDGKLEFTNFFSRSDTKTESGSQSYNQSPYPTNYEIKASYSPQEVDILSNILTFQYNFPLIDMGATISNSYSDNINPGSWNVTFLQRSGWNGISTDFLSTEQFAKLAASLINPGDLSWDAFGTNNSHLKQNSIAGSVYFEKNFVVSSLVTGSLKFGGEYENSFRSYDYNAGNGTLSGPEFSDARAALLGAFPWMTKPPYNILPDGSANIPFSPFILPGYSYGRFLNGDYPKGPAVDFDLVHKAMQTVIDYENGKTNSSYGPDPHGSNISDYSGSEYRSACYIMGKINVGADLDIIGGVRYQGLETSYKANQYLNFHINPADPLLYRDTTINAVHEYHGLWLPNLILIYRPISWLNLRAAYTNTLVYPDYSNIIPIVDQWNYNNYTLKPAKAQNFDLSISVYNNTSGLLTIDGFLKRINNLVRATKTSFYYPSWYPGLQHITPYPYNTAINSPYRGDVRGIEAEWKMHFWYLPGVLSGFSADMNYTHIFSSTKYIHSSWVFVSPPIPLFANTFYDERLIDQPNDVFNLSVGYEYKGFSVCISMIYQSNIFKDPVVHSYEPRYRRLDFAAKQDLPWTGLSIYANVNNITDAYNVIQATGNRFPTSEQTYGMTANVGLRWNLIQ